MNIAQEGHSWCYQYSEIKLAKLTTDFQSMNILAADSNISSRIFWTNDSLNIFR